MMPEVDKPKTVNTTTSPCESPSGLANAACGKTDAARNHLDIDSVDGAAEAMLGTTGAAGEAVACQDEDKPRCHNVDGTTGASLSHTRHIGSDVGSGTSACEEPCCAAPSNVKSDGVGGARLAEYPDLSFECACLPHFIQISLLLYFHFITTDDLIEFESEP